MKSQIKKQDIVAFAGTAQWRRWLARNHKNPGGVWLRIFKKGSGVATVTYDQALDEVLCFGWIDGQKRSYDSESFLQKFTPRRKGSIWSKRNREHVARLVEEKRMTSAGLKEVGAAKAEGRWDGAYDPASTMKIPADFLNELKKDKKAYAFFLTLNKANLYSIGFRLQTAKKPETRAKRMSQILEMMKSGKKFH